MEGYLTNYCYNPIAGIPGTSLNVLGVWMSGTNAISDTWTSTIPANVLAYDDFCRTNPNIVSIFADPYPLVSQAFINSNSVPRYSIDSLHFNDPTNGNAAYQMVFGEFYRKFFGYNPFLIAGIFEPTTSWQSVSADNQGDLNIPGIAYGNGAGLTNVIGTNVTGLVLPVNSFYTITNGIIVTNAGVATIITSNSVSAGAFQMGNNTTSGLVAHNGNSVICFDGTYYPSQGKTNQYLISPSGSVWWVCNTNITSPLASLYGQMDSASGLQVMDTNGNMTPLTVVSSNFTATANTPGFIGNGSGLTNLPVPVETLQMASTTVTLGGNSATFFSTPGTAANTTASKNFMLIVTPPPFTISNWTFLAVGSTSMSNNWGFELYSNGVPDAQMFLTLLTNAVGAPTYSMTNDNTQFIHVTASQTVTNIQWTGMLTNFGATTGTLIVPSVKAKIYPF